MQKAWSKEGEIPALARFKMMVYCRRLKLDEAHLVVWRHNGCQLQLLRDSQMPQAGKKNCTNLTTTTRVLEFPPHCGRVVARSSADADRRNLDLIIRKTCCRLPRTPTLHPDNILCFESMINETEKEKAFPAGKEFSAERCSAPRDKGKQCNKSSE